MFCQAACINKKRSVTYTRDFTRFGECQPACRQTSGLVRKLEAHKELPTNYLPETTAHERDIPGLCLTSFGINLLFRGVSHALFNIYKDFYQNSYNKSYYLPLSSIRQLSVKPEAVKCNIINYAMKICLIETCFYCIV